MVLLVMSVLFMCRYPALRIRIGGIRGPARRTKWLLGSLRVTWPWEASKHRDLRSQDDPMKVPNPALKVP